MYIVGEEGKERERESILFTKSLSKKKEEEERGKRGERESIRPVRLSLCHTVLTKNSEDFSYNGLNSTTTSIVYMMTQCLLMNVKH